MMRVVRPTVPSNLLVETGLTGWCEAGDWLVGCFWFNGPLKTVLQSISGRLPKRGRERIVKSKNV